METEEAVPEPDNEVHVVTESPNEPDSEGNDQDEQIEQWKSFNLGVRPVISIMEEQPIDLQSTRLTTMLSLQLKSLRTM